MKLKKLLAVVLAFAMILSTMSFTVLAEEVADADSLKNAIALGGEIVLSSDIEIAETLEISGDAVIDLNGCTLSGSLTNLIKANAGNIVITNGTIKNVMENATETLTSVYLTGNAVAEIKNVEIETSGTGIYLDENAKITELNATVDSYMNANGYCTFDAVSVNGNARIDVISGGNYTSNYTEEYINLWNEVHSYSGIVSYTIRVDGTDASIGEIKDGKFIGVADKSNCGSTIMVNSGKIEKISGGYFGFAKVGITAQYPDKLLYANTSNGGSIVSIVGGTFEKGNYSTGFGCDFEGIVTESGALTEETGETVNVTTYFSSSVKETVLNVYKVYLPAPVYVVELYRASEMARSGELVLVDSFTSLEAALAEAEDGDTIKVIKDFEIKEQVDIDKEITLDLNGKNITSAYQAGSDSKHIYPFGVVDEFTVVDSVGTGSISGRGILVNDGSKFTVESGNIYAIDYNGGSAIFMHGGEVVVNGGRIEQDAPGTYNFAVNANAGKVTVNGGWIGGNHGAIAAGGAEVVLNNGTFVCTGTAGMTDNVLYTYDTGAITINNGTFIADKDIASGGCCIYDANGGVLVNNGNFSNSSGGDVWGTTGTTIKGGTFENLIETKHVVEGATIVNGGKTMVKTEGSLKEAVAVINGTIYSTFDEALEAAKSLTGDVTVEILGKVSLKTSIGGSFDSIKFVGKNDNAEIYMDIQGYIEAPGKDVAFEGLKLSKVAGGFVTNAGFMNVAFGIYAAKSVSYEDCVFVNGAYSSGDTTFEGCTFYRSHDRYGLWVYGDTTCVVDGCTFDDIRGIKVYHEGKLKTADLTVKNTEFTENVNNKPAIVLTNGESVTLENNTYSSTGVFELDLDGNPNGTVVTSDVAPTCVNDNGPCGVLVDGKIYTTVADAAEVAEKGSEVTLLHNSTETVELPMGVILDKNGFTADGVTVETPVATIGTTEYKTIAEAFAAAKDGETITLLTDATPALTSQRAITKAAVIDLNGKKLTLTEDDLYFGTTTFKNGNIVVDPSVKASTAVFWMFKDQTLTFDNVKVVATGVDGTYLIGLDGNNADLNIINGSEIVVDNDTALDLDIICVNATTGNDILVENSKVNVKNLDGRVFFRGNYTISGDSDINLSGITKAGFRIEKGQSLVVKDNAKIEITGDLRDGGIHLTDPYVVYTKADTATVNATVNVTATGLSGSGTEADPYLINNLAELKWFRDKVDTQAADGSSQFAGKYFLLTADIDLAGENWNPIGSMSGDHGSFKGVFDGGYHTISNLYVAQPGNGIGLFARTSDNAVIKNLDLENVTVKSTDNSNYVGGLVGNAYASTKIENVSIQGKIEISGRGYVGGIAGHGYVVMDAVSVLPSETGLISSTFWCAGGILGYAGEGLTSINNAYVENLVVTSAAGGLGAIVGMAEDNKGTQPISGSNLSAKDVEIKTYTGAYGDAYANYALGYLYGGNPTSKLTGSLSVENVKIETSSGVAPEVQDAVAAIGNDIYFNLQDAISKVNDGETIKVLRDITFTQGVNGNGISCTRDASFTLDLNGKTLSSNLGNITLRFKIGDGTYVTKSDVEITIKNGKVISGASNWCAISAATNTSSGVKLTLNLENVEAEANKGGDYAVKAWDGAVINAENVDVKGNVAGGFYAYGGEIILDDCTVVQTGRHSAIYMNSALAVAGKGKLTVNSGTYTSVPADNKSGHVGYVLSSGGQFIINGGKFVNNAENCTGGSPLMEFDASAVVELNGGEFEAAQSVMHVINNTGVASANPVVNVFGGNYDSVTGDVMFSGYPAGQLHIAGGSYSHDPSAYLVANFSANAENGMYKVSRSALDGTGTETDPYIISDVYDLTLFRDSVNKGETKYNAAGVWVALASDIDMTGVVWDKGIGVETATDLIVFEGNFDGNGKTIKNLTINQTKHSYYQMAALFGGIYGNVIIKNLTLENPTIICDFANFDKDKDDSVCVGALVGLAYNCTDALIENVTVKGDIVIDAPDTTGVGGLVGYTYGKFGKIKNCSVVGNEGSYIKAISQVGGLVGYNYEGASEFTGCAVKNLTISAHGYMGGLVGVAQTGNIIKNNEIKNVKLILLDESLINLVGSVVGSVSGSKLTVEDYTVVDVKCNNKDVPVIGGKYDEPNVAYVAEINNVIYTSLEDAIAAAVNGDTIKLLADLAIEGKTFTIPADKAITIDFNGKTIKALDNKASGNYEVFSNKGNLTVVGNGTIELEAETNRGWGGYSAIFHNHGGILTINNGTFTHKGGTDMAYVVDNSANYSPDATTNIYGGNLSSTYVAIRNYMDKHTSNGGASGIATVNVADGNIYGYKRGIWAQISSAPAKGNVAITGGTITSVLQDAVLIDDDDASEISTIISGGTFSSDVSAFVPENIDCVQNADGTYSVVADREINIAVNKTELYAGEEVEVTVSIVGDDMAYADWKLSYNPAHFEFVSCTGVNTISNHDAANGVYRNATFFENGVSVYQSGQTLMTYTFKALAQETEVTSAFTLSETFATTYAEGIEATHVVAGTNGKADVTILLNEYEFVKKLDGAVVEGSSAKVSYDNNAHTFEVVPSTLPTGVGYTVTYKVDGKDVSAVELTERGTYFIDYVINADKGYADYKGSFTVIVGEAAFEIEVNEYTAASDLILVYTNTDDIRFKYDGTAMIDVTADRDAEGTNYTKYTYNGVEYKYVYGYVAKYEDGIDYSAKITYTGDATEVFKIDNAYKLADVNFSNTLNVQDITTIYGIANDNKDLVAKVKYQKQLLKADTNGNKKVDGDDTGFVVDAVKTALNLK